MNPLLDILSFFFLGLGVFVLLVACIGMHRMPDLFSRLHAVSLIDTLGMISILIGLMLIAGISLISMKLFIILVFILFTSPATTHALAKAALHTGMKPEAEKPDD